MTDKTINKIGNVGGDYFRLEFLRASKHNLQFYLDQFDINDYYIFKSTRHFKLVEIEYFLDFKYAGYILFKKDKYNLENTLKWIDFMKNNFSYRYFAKPFPPFDPYEKIKIIDRYE